MAAVLHRIKMASCEIGMLLILTVGFLMLVVVDGYGTCPKTAQGLILARGAAKLVHTPMELFEGKLLEGKDFKKLAEMCNSTDEIDDGIGNVENAVKYCIYKDRWKQLDGFDISGLNETFKYMCELERRDVLRNLTRCLNSKENKASIAKCRKKHYGDRAKNVTDVEIGIENKCTWFRATVYCAETATTNPKCDKPAIEMYKEMTKRQLPVCDCNDKVRHPNDMKSWSGSYKCKASRCVSFMGQTVDEATVETHLMFGASHVDHIEWMCNYIPAKKAFRIVHSLTQCIVQPECFYLTKQNKFKLINANGMIKAAEYICNNSALIKNETDNFMDGLTSFTECQSKKHQKLDEDYQKSKDMKDILCKKHAANRECLRVSFINSTSTEVYEVLEKSLQYRLPNVCDCKPRGIDPRAVTAGAEVVYLSSIIAILIPFIIHRAVL